MGLNRIKQWFSGVAASAEEAMAGREPVATPPRGAPSGDETDDDQRETSTNAQVAGAEGQPWNT